MKWCLMPLKMWILPIRLLKRLRLLKFSEIDMTVIQHKTYSSVPQSLTLGALAEKTQTVLQGDPELLISGVGTLSNATPGQITFLVSPQYHSYLATTRACAVVLTPAHASDS